MIGQLHHRKHSSVLSKPMFGYFSKPARMLSDRDATLRDMDNFTGLDSTNKISEDQKHMLSEANSIFA